MGRAVKRTLLGAALLLALTVVPLSARAQEVITIEGQVTNGTAGAEVPQDLMVTLEVFSQGQNLETKEAVTDAEGRFSFEGVPGGQEYGYIISTEYSEAVYFFERDYVLLPDLVEMMVYESTSSSEAIEVRLHSLVVNMADSDTRLMNAQEWVRLENTGDRTFVPGPTPAGTMNMLRFSLPPTASNLDVQSTLWSGQIFQVDLGFALNTPVPPGTHEIAYTYLASYADGKLTFAHSFPFGADTFSVLLLQDLGQVTGTGLQKMEHLVLDDGNYQRLEAYSLNAGDRITLNFTGMSEPSLWQRWQDAVSGEGLLKGVIPGAFGMALVALLAYVLFRKREPPRATAGVPGDPGQHPALTEAIARLDDRFQQREIGKQEYLQRRRELKGQILGSGDRLPWSQARPRSTRPTSEGGGPPSDPAAGETGGEEAKHGG
ncbi:MAG: carboxypeptidase-like regulatory domain-containing protein [Chloroflexota bacterium]